MLYAIGAVLNILTKGSYYYYVALNPYMILHGQIWRLLGFLIVPPNASLIFIIFVLMFYYSIGESLVQVSINNDFHGYFLFELIHVFSLRHDIPGDAGISLWYSSAESKVDGVV